MFNDQPASRPAALLLRRVAFFGAAASLLWQFVSITELRPRQGWGFLVLAAAVLAVAVTLAVMPAELAKLLRHTDVLVPLGLYVTAQTALGLLTALPAAAALLTPGWPVKVLFFGFTLSAGLVASLALAVVHAGWTTILIFQAVLLDRVNAPAGLANLKPLFFRVLGVAFVGHVGVIVGAAAAFAAYRLSIVLTLLLLLAVALLWNLATSALLPVALAEGGPFLRSVRRGVRASWGGVGRWWRPLVWQMVLLGCVTFVYVSYTTEGPGRDTWQTTKTNWEVHAFWTGGYESDCRWYDELMETAEAEPLRFVNTSLGLVFSVLAVAIKLRIVSELYAPATAGGETAMAEATPGELTG